jgi:hypothetical protein
MGQAGYASAPAIAVGAWHGGSVPAILGIALSTGLVMFLHAPAGQFPTAFHDFPLFCLYFFLVSWVYWFSRDRRRTELLLEQAGLSSRQKSSCESKN